MKLLRNRLFLFSFFLLWGCHPSSQPPDVSEIHMDQKIFRFDQQLMEVDTVHPQPDLKKLKAEYPTFFPAYMNLIMGFDDNDGQIDLNIRKFIAGKDIRDLQKYINEQYPTEKIIQLQDELNHSFRYIKYYLPDFKAPRIVTFMSALANYGAITVDSVLGIGLDMFLGEDFPLYQKIDPPYPSYLLKRFNQDNIVPSCIKVIAQDLFPPPERGTLLDQMIAQGKILYFLDKTMPKLNDTLKIGYTEKDLKWCQNNEQSIWQYFISQKLLYTKKPLTIRYYIGVSPSSRGMPSEAPGNIGSWVGWQIIRKFMEKNSKISLSKLMEMKDSQQILNQSGYHPH